MATPFDYHADDRHRPLLYEQRAAAIQREDDLEVKSAWIDNYLATHPYLGGRERRDKLKRQARVEAERDNLIARLWPLHPDTGDSILTDCVLPECGEVVPKDHHFKYGGQCEPCFEARATGKPRRYPSPQMTIAFGPCH
jgi:hypothetical protein